ncbi:hypothetical protein ABW19_dt0209766 [Dactylella cylindrospora]|nr:hypothetical protein ABW19_dt0209766 [Dactylella cylindrospora]
MPRPKPTFLSIPITSYRSTPDSTTPTSGTLTPGTVIFDSSTLYTPTSPAKPYIYASYLPTDEKSLRVLLKAERSEANRIKRTRWCILILWMSGVILIVGFWGLSAWCKPYGSVLSQYLNIGYTSTHSQGGVAAIADEKPEVHLNANMTYFTVSMPQDEAAYPLPGEMYAGLCRDVEMKSMMTFEKRVGRKMQAHRGYCAPDEGYLGLEGERKKESGDRGESVVGDLENGECEMTLTYVVDDDEGREAGVGAVVLGMWMAYGLAQMEGREFFVEGGNWVYGDIRNYFNIPPSLTNCTPPPMSRRLPCPRNTAHKLITPSTYKDAFGHTFEDEFEDPRKMQVMRQKPIYQFLRTGYEAISLSSDLQNSITERVKSIGVTNEKDVVAVQIRRGDRLAKEWRWHKGYIPVDRFMKVSKNESGVDIVESSHDDGRWPKHYFLPDYPATKSEDQQPLRIVSSDDSDIFEDGTLEKSGCVRAQESSVAVGQPGGFWAEDVRDMDREDAERLAVGYLVDFGVLTESLKAAKSGWAVCGYYGDLCRMIAVGMG